MSNQLPKGFHVDETAWGYSEATQKYEVTDLTKQCECGAIITYGNNIKGWQHSTWCQMYKNDKESEIKNDNSNK